MLESFFRKEITFLLDKFSFFDLVPSSGCILSMYLCRNSSTHDADLGYFRLNTKYIPNSIFRASPNEFAVITDFRSKYIEISLLKLVSGKSQMDN